MGEEDKKQDGGSSWYKGWFMLIQPDSPLATQSGAYDIGILKNPSSMLLIQGGLGPSMEDFEKPPGVYITQRTYDKLKFKRQADSSLKSELNVLGTNEEGWEYLKKTISSSFKDRKDVCVDYVELTFKDDSVGYVLLGINYDNTITAEDYEAVLKINDSKVVKSMTIGREKLGKPTKEVSKENNDLNTQDINLV